MVDYTKWDNWEKQTEKQELEEQRLRELYELQQKNPEKIQEMKEDLEKLKENVKRDAYNGTPKDQAKEVSSKLRREANSMKEKLKKLKEKEKEMEEQQVKLDQLMSAGDPASILKFFESQGMNINDIQKMVGGSDKETRDVIKETAVASSRAFTDKEESEIENTLKVTEQLERSVLGDSDIVEEGLQAQGDAETKNKEQKKKKQAEKKAEKKTIIPEYSQLIPAKGKNKGSVVVKIQLPLLSGARGVQLDVSDTQFRMFAPIPDGNANYLLNFSLRCPVDPNAAVAKWVKKDNALKVVLNHA